MRVISHCSNIIVSVIIVVVAMQCFRKMIVFVKYIQRARNAYNFIVAGFTPPKLYQEDFSPDVTMTINFADTTLSQDTWKKMCISSKLLKMYDNITSRGENVPFRLFPVLKIDIVGEYHPVLVAFMDTSNNLYISCRGMKSFIGPEKNSASNFSQVPVSLGNTETGMIHRGFGNVYTQHVQQKFTHFLKTLNTTPDNIILGGHSMGGCIATLCAVDAKQTFPNVNTTVFTFATPRFTNPSLKNKILQILNNRIFKITNDGDDICVLPLSNLPNWQHTQKITLEFCTIGKQMLDFSSFLGNVSRNHRMRVYNLAAETVYASLFSTPLQS